METTHFTTAINSPLLTYMVYLSFHYQTLAQQRNAT